MNSKLLEGKNAIVTGTARGMGSEILRLFAKNGANIWACARTETPELLERYSSLSKEYRVEIWPLFFDLADAEAIKTAFMEIRRSKRQVDILVNNAGITYNALFQMSSMAEVRNQMEVNFFAPYLLTQYVSKLMTRTGGSIINTASSAAFDGNPGKTAYGASKAALVAMTHSLANELGKYGVRANCIAPGITDTDMLQTMPEKVVEDLKESVALQRCGTVSDVAKTALFLASDLSSYVTGQVIRVDGGM